MKTAKVIKIEHRETTTMQYNKVTAVDSEGKEHSFVSNKDRPINIGDVLEIHSCSSPATLTKT